MRKTLFSLFLLLSLSSSFCSPIGHHMQRFYDEDNFQSEIKLNKPKRFSEQYYLSITPVLQKKSLSFIDTGSNNEQVLDLGLSKGIEFAVSGFTHSDFLRHISAEVKAGIYDHELSGDDNYKTFDFQSTWEFGKKWRFGNGVGFKKKGLAHNLNGTNKVDRIKILYMNFLANHQNYFTPSLYYKVEAKLILESGTELDSGQKVDMGLGYCLSGKVTKKIDDFIYSFSVKYKQVTTVIEEVEALSKDLDFHFGLSFPI